MNRSKEAKFIRILLVHILLFALFTSTIISQQVTPSDRVENYVNVRQAANTQSQVVGRLNKGETASLLDEVPYWYKIELNNGTIGFISKAWTIILEIPEPTTGKTDLIIGSWNIKWFGYYSEDKHNYTEMAKIIQKMDVIAIQELRGSRYQKRVDSLIAQLARNGFRYQYIISDETGYKSNQDTAKKNYIERYCFLWDVDRVEIKNSNSPISFVATPKINNPTFRQVPIVADFKVRNGNGFDFRIMTIHTVYNKEINQVRRQEIQFVNDWIIGQSTNVQNTEKNIIAIGDFNANPDGQPHHFADIVSGTTEYRVLFEEPQTAAETTLRTTVQQTSNPGPDYFLLPVYDHALVSNETSYALPHNPMTRGAGDLGIVEFDQEEYWQNFNDWDYVIRAMSDHRPIWFNIDYNALDSD